MHDPYNLYSIVLELGATEKGFLKGTLGRALHAQVLKWFSISDSQLAEQLHQAQISPFVISPLFGKRRPKLTKAGDRFFFRVSLLRGDLLQPLITSLEKQNNQIITLDKFSFQLCQTHIIPGSHSLAGVSNYALIYHSNISSRLTLQFKSATSFKSGKNNIQSFPLPELVFNSLRRRWNHFAPEELHFPDLEWQAYVCAFDLKTFGIQLKKKEIGCQGWATYIFPDNEQAKIASVLAQFAFFAGVGRKTTMGMGQVSVNSDQ